MLYPHDLARYRSALNSIPSDLPRVDWVKAGMAAHAAGLSRDDFLEWSASAASYKAQSAIATWRSFKAGGGVTEASLIEMAKAHGWRDDAARPAPSASPAPKPKPAPKPPAPGMSAAEVWARCEPATASHGYAAAKGLNGAPLETLRTVPAGDALRIARNNMAGALVVPGYAGDGTLQTLQFIPPPGAGKKLNLPGAPVSGASFVVGELVPGAPVYVCESVGTAWACWRATGFAAVAAFGAGNMARIAADLHQRDSAARLVVVPDRGEEAQAETIARELGCAVAFMPDDAPHNFDAADFAAREGDDDALAMLLENAVGFEAAPVVEEPKAPHPLALFVDLSEEPKAPRWVVPGFMAHGVTVIAGAHGVGKTTTLLPLAMAVCGMPTVSEELRPQHWRHVIYVVEELAQAERIIAGLVRHSGLGIDWQTVRERLHIVEAKRLPPDYVAMVAPVYRERFTRDIDGVELPPLVVIDTMAASLEIDSENDNSEASRAMAALKQGFAGLPVWLVGHLAKGNLSRSDAQGLTLRGAGAFEADANAVLYLVREGDARFLVRGKTRFEARWPELAIASHYTETVGQSEFGGFETMGLRWATLAPPERSRKESAIEEQDNARKRATEEIREEVRNVIATAWALGHPLNREGVKAAVKRKRNDVSDTIENLLSERWVVEVPVPAKERLNARKSAFLVSLSTAQHDAVNAGDAVPVELLTVPDSWRKEAPPPPIPSVPEQLPAPGEKDSNPLP